MNAHEATVKIQAARLEAERRRKIAEEALSSVSWTDVMPFKVKLALEQLALPLPWQEK